MRAVFRPQNWCRFFLRFFQSGGVCLVRLGLRRSLQATAVWKLWNLAELTACEAGFLDETRHKTIQVDCLSLSCSMKHRPRADADIGPERLLWCHRQESPHLFGTRVLTRSHQATFFEVASRGRPTSRRSQSPWPSIRSRLPGDCGMITWAGLWVLGTFFPSLS